MASHALCFTPPTLRKTDAGSHRIAEYSVEESGIDRKIVDPWPDFYFDSDCAFFLSLPYSECVATRES